MRTIRVRAYTMRGRGGSEMEVKGEWARYNVEFLFRNFPFLFFYAFLALAGLYLFYLFSWFIAFRSLLLWSLLSASLKPAESEKQAKEWIFSFSENEAKEKKKSGARRKSCVYVERMMSAQRKAHGAWRIQGFCVHLIYLLLLYLWILLVINFRVINHGEIIILLSLLLLSHPSLCRCARELMGEKMLRDSRVVRELSPPPTQ